MSLRPGDLLGLPVWADSPADHVVLRYLLVALALVCAFLAARGRRALLVVSAIVFVEAVLLFWTGALGQPYALFADVRVTRAAAAAATAGLPGTDGPLAGEARVDSMPVRLAGSRLGPEWLIAGPSLLPLAVVPLLGLLIFAGGPRETAPAAAVFWLAFSTPEAAAVRGEGFLPGLWSHPSAALALVVAVAAAFAAGRLRSRFLAVALGLAAVLALGLVPPAEAAPSFAQRLLAATLEHGPWLLLGGYGLARGAPAVAWSLTAGGSALSLLGLGDPWPAQAAARMGWILAGTAPLLLLTRMGAEALLPARLCQRLRTGPDRLGLAALLALTLPGSFTARWNPFALDPTAEASRPPLSRNLQPGFDWIRTQSPPYATCVASPDYAALVAVVGGRRVLRAPELWEPSDDQRRRRAERMLAAGREPELARRYAVGCFVLASGDEGWLGLAEHQALAGVPGFDVGYRDAYVTVYRVSPDRFTP